MTIIPYQKYRLSLICVSGDDIFQLTALRDPDSSPPRYKSTINELSLVMLQIQIWIIISLMVLLYITKTRLIYKHIQGEIELEQFT